MAEETQANAEETTTAPGAGATTETTETTTQQNGAANGADTQQTTQETTGDSASRLTTEEGPDSIQPPAWSELVNGIQDEKVRNALGSTDSLENLGRDFLRLKEEIGSRIKVPGKDAPAEEVAKFRKAIGAGEGPEAYQEVPFPEGYEPNELDNQLVEKFSQIAYEHGVPLEAFKGLAQDYFGVADQIEQARNEAIEQHQKERDKALQVEWGSDYERNKNAAQYARDNLFSDEIKAIMDTPLEGMGMMVGDHPDMIKFMARLGLSMKEGGAPLAGMTENERQSIEQEIEELRKDNPIGSPGREKIEPRLQELYQKLYGTDPA